MGIMILTEANWARPLLPGVLASDALSPVTEWRGVSGIPQTSLRWVEFLKFEDGDVWIYLLVVIPLKELGFVSIHVGRKFSVTVLVVRFLSTGNWLR